MTLEVADPTAANRFCAAAFGVEAQGRDAAVRAVDRQPRAGGQRDDRERDQEDDGQGGRGRDDRDVPCASATIDADTVWESLKPRLTT